MKPQLAIGRGGQLRLRRGQHPEPRRPFGGMPRARQSNIQLEMARLGFGESPIEASAAESDYTPQCIKVRGPDGRIVYKL